ncbi:MAG: FRG domain-containing protein [Candidatus Thiodiazotropha endolucinida]
MENYDFDKVPLWSDEKPAFEITSDDVSGRIPVTRVEHWKEFTELLESNFFNHPNIQLAFRGHRRFDWELLPTLARIPESGIIDEPLATSQLEHFKRAVRGRLADNSLVLDGEEDELWSVGQHHGLMTPLLDWTYSPYVALFFAFQKEDTEEEKDNPYRAIYVLNKTFVSDDEVCPDIRMFEPRKDDHGRLVNQAGLFTFSPYNSTIENKLTDTLAAEDFEDEELRNASEDEQAGIIARYICKIYIKNEDREGCMRALRRMNVHHASLFPDLIGASEYCNLMVAEERREYELTQSAERYEQIHTEPESISHDSINYAYWSDTEDTAAVAILLGSHAESAVKPGRIQMIAEKIVSEINKLKTVDWKIREPIKSQMRSKMRITLRRLGYPANRRDGVTEAILKHLIDQSSESN